MNEIQTRNLIFLNLLSSTLIHIDFEVLMI